MIFYPGQIEYEHPPVKKRYPLRIETAGIDEDTVFSRGHHDIEAFRQAAAHHTGYDKDDFAKVYREYWRARPAPPGEGCDIYYDNAEGPGRGAFPVTYAYLD